MPLPTNKNDFLKALDTHAHGGVELAIHLYKRILCNAPGHLKVLGPMATGLAQLGNPSGALPWFERAKVSEAGFTDTASNHVTALFALGNNNRALMVARSAMILQPVASLNYANLGKAKIALGQNDRGLENLRKALLLEPLRADLHSSIAEVNLRCGLYERAMTSVMQAVAIDPLSGLQDTLLGRIQQKIGDDRVATISLERSLHLNPFNAEARSLLGEYHYAQKRFPDAQRLFLHAILLAPCSFKPGLGLARCLIEEGELEGALPWTGRALKLAPRSPAIRSLRAQTLISAQCYPEALLELHNFITLLPLSLIHI